MSSRPVPEVVRVPASNTSPVLMCEVLENIGHDASMGTGQASISLRASWGTLLHTYGQGLSHGWNLSRETLLRTTSSCLWNVKPVGLGDAPIHTVEFR